ncbi:hypothetical protein [Spirosoma endbachense]|uniref:Uncharacterized protein n=1 Tax=Spirosoma endbachense TaxID=2666025 RepID=A0A6P1VT15_9BACT|nr:hypothetical protein [Spirosoma endbachense]QHV96223.1 hypothetical protein GJR95_14920 [Spirosoma endbachense]
MNNTNVGHQRGSFQLISTDAHYLSTNEKASLSNVIRQLGVKTKFLPFVQV